jgi:hypothetical protein
LSGCTNRVEYFNEGENEWLVYSWVQNIITSYRGPS